MKEAELAKHTTCSCCGRLVTQTGLPLFWVVRIERYGISLPAMKRQMGLSDFLGGNSALARIMGPDEDLARPMMDAVTATLCERCAVDSDGPQIAAIAEMAK